MEAEEDLRSKITEAIEEEQRRWSANLRSVE